MTDTNAIELEAREDARRWMSQLPREQFEKLLILIRNAEGRGRRSATAELARQSAAKDAEIAEMRETIVAFAGPWAVQHAREHDLPKGHLHPTHYDILSKAGGRMDDFTRATGD